MTTYYNQAFYRGPIETSSTKLPSHFQIGDQVILTLSESENVIEVVGYIFAVNFTSCAVSYSVAVPTETPHTYAIVSGVRGGMRLFGADQSSNTELVDVQAVEQFFNAFTQRALGLQVLDGGCTETDTTGSSGKSAVSLSLVPPKKDVNDETYS